MGGLSTVEYRGRLDLAAAKVEDRDGVVNPSAEATR
jgi:hypothetical protein